MTLPHRKTPAPLVLIAAAALYVVAMALASTLMGCNKKAAPDGAASRIRTQ